MRAILAMAYLSQTQQGHFPVNRLSDHSVFVLLFIPRYKEIISKISKNIETNQIYY